jgi:predicted dehydrogenase
MLRVAIVGLGWWGKRLVASVQGKTQDIQFTTGCVRNRAKAEEFCRANSLTLVDDYAAVLADPHIDAVVLATPPSLHGEQAQQAAAAGKHVFVEKPFTLTVDVAQETLAATKKAGVVLAVGFNRRFHPSMNELRARVRDGRLGIIEGCLFEQTAGGLESVRADDWRANRTETPAGAMTGIGIHIVDGMINLFGAVREVHCLATRRVEPLVDDTTAVLVKFASGVSGVFFCSFVTVPNYRIAVYGSNGMAEILKPTLEEFRFAPLSNAKAGHLGGMQPEVIVTPGFDTVSAELKAFAAAVGQQRPYPVPLEEVLHGVEVFEAIAASARLNAPVALH